MNARDVMTSKLTSVTPDMPLVEVAQLLVRERISSVPVIDRGRLVGIISEGDLIHRSEIGTSHHHRWWQVLSLSAEDHAAELLKVHGVRAEHVMTRQVVTANEDTTLGQIVDMFDRFHINRVPVMRDGSVVGIVSRSDLVRLLISGQRASLSGRSDADIAKEVEALLAEAAEATVTPISTSINYEVKDGVVYLSGVVADDLEVNALQISVESLPGVRGVKADLAVMPRSIAAI